ncbi:sodium:calcium antiporter [uncultured Sphingomonas sp.]|uniref:sodium:calcium antiporter n=1 Tax=uncultured Sphingomonas sp. TaxID=158754 RepID=UPI0025CFED2B|nr:sodium:calcium antiporter [uncultured Sphingomonas sp.]
MSGLWLATALLLGAAIAIYLSCELFVNGVEWLGRSLSVGSKATGSVLAAFGTALPESIVTLVAVAFGGAETKALGVGAALGGPLALATVAYATVGVSLILSRQQLANTPAMRGAFRGLARDQGWFLTIFAAKIALGLFVFAWKPWLGLFFLAAYGLYIRKEMAGPGEDEGELEPLTFAPGHATPPLLRILLQTVLALTIIFVASHLFVGQLATLAPLFGVEPQLVALLLSPIATELPETMNAIIWVRQGKHRLALANISGAMMIQATVPTAFGLFWTPWLLDRSLLLAAAVTASAIAVMILAFRAGRVSRALFASMGLFYLLFAALLIAMRAAG